MWNLYIPPCIGCRMYSLDFLSWTSFEEKLLCCWVWTEPRCGLPENLSFSKVLWNWSCGGWCLCDCWCPSFYSWTIRLRPMFWRASKLCFCWLLSLSLFKFGREAKLLWKNFQKPSCLLLGTEGNLLSFLGNLKENALSLQVWVQLIVASFWLGFFIMSSALLVIHFILHYFMHIEQTKVNVMDQLINQWHCPDTAKNLICSILWLFFFS